eukprot:TRINITY_DN6940_c0_g1_i1.p1 TRINITY_DN6940_c0_g1~~TRINITY_DN6940_c0_g1_i1.p1  ORF type:complete len:626 (+),score=154.03 TRINITY_DN6940_c0_g1_i1:51-1928(+)
MCIRDRPWHFLLPPSALFIGYLGEMAKSLSLVLISVILSLTFVVAQSAITIRSIDRMIDLTTQLSNQAISINFINSGSEPVSEFQYVIQKSLADKVSYFVAKDESGEALSVDLGTYQAGGDTIPLYRIKLNKALEPQATSTIRVSIVLTHTMSAHPAEIAQKDGQLVRYRDNHFFYSVYTTLSQETRLKLASVKVAAYSKQKPSQLKGDLLRYGPYNDVAPFSISNMTVHFENNSPFVVVKSLVKEYEVSQWGNLAVEETYEVAHEGAKITGPFNRFEFQRFGAPSSVNSIVRRVPREASDIYYRDVIGNISTSHLSDFKENIRIDLIPRFPLFGGWKNAFYIGWNLPLKDYLSVSADDASQYVLNVSFSAANNFLSIDDYTLRIILPEGASDIKPVLPFDVDSESEERHFTYLDVSGRPVLVLKKKNIVNEHDQQLYVLYRFKSTAMLQEPLLLVTAFFVFFLSIIVITRIDLSITQKVRPVVVEFSGKEKETLAKFNAAQAKREEVYDSLDSAANKAIAAKNAAGFTAAKQSAEASVKSINQESNKALQELKSRPDLYDVAKKIVDLEQERFDLKVKINELEINIKKSNKPSASLEKTLEGHKQSYAALESQIEKESDKLSYD